MQQLLFRSLLCSWCRSHSVGSTAGDAADGRDTLIVLSGIAHTRHSALLDGRVRSWHCVGGWVEPLTARHRPLQWLNAIGVAPDQGQSERLPV